METRINIPDVLQNQVTINPNHSLNIVFKTIDELVSTAKLFNQRLPLEAAGREILQTIFANNSSNFFYKNIITRNLKNVSDIYIHIGCEVTRLKFADKLFNLTTLQKLWSTAKTSLCEIRFIVDVLTNKLAPMQLSYDNLSSLDLLTSNDLAILNFLIDKLKFNATAALRYFDSCPAYLPAYNPLLDGPVEITVSDRAFYCKQIEVAVDSFKKNQRLYARVSNRYKELTRFDTELPPNQFNFQPRIFNALKTTSQIILHIGCKQMRLQLGHIMFELERIKRPLQRGITDYREIEFLSMILNKRILTNFSEIFFQTSSTAITDTKRELNTFQLILLANNLNTTRLTLYDNCPIQSPFSADFHPEDQRTLEPLFPYDIIDIHTKILELCNHFNAMFFIKAMLEKSVKFFTEISPKQKCLNYHIDNQKNVMHGVLTQYLPENIHRKEDEISDLINSSIIIPAVMASFTLALLFYIAFRKRKKSEPRRPQYPRQLFSPPAGSASGEELSPTTLQIHPRQNFAKKR